jgi:hypothetical protein
MRKMSVGKREPGTTLGAVVCQAGNEVERFPEDGFQVRRFLAGRRQVIFGHRDFTLKSVAGMDSVGEIRAYTSNSFQERNFRS